MKETTDQARLIAAVRKHAEANYPKGWDVIVECWTDEQIVEAIGETNVKSELGAIRLVSSHVKLWNERRREVESTAF